VSEMLRQLEKFSAAEEFLDFFSIPYDAHVVQVNRLHILKRFNQYLARDVPAETLDSEQEWEAYRNLLLRAYEDFIRSTPLQERVFKVLQEGSGGSVGLDQLSGTLPSRRRTQ